MIIRNLLKTDFASIKSIYQQGIDTGHATFQKQAKDWDEWDKSVMSVCRLVAVINDDVVGWAAISTVSSRCVYIGRAEVSIYVKAICRGSGIGHSLLSALVKCSEEEGIWTLESGIFSENHASIAVHKKNGFKVVGVREKLGKMNHEWRDLIFMERRSSSVGV
jgi:phosphinothricin acetyltransferase